MPRKRQGLRVFHQKTRNGCLQCKKRRVKCDMKSPRCSNCMRRTEFCQYPPFVDERTVQLEVQSSNGHPLSLDDLAVSLVPNRSYGPAAYMEILHLQRLRHEAMRPSIALPITSKQAEQTLTLVFHYSWFTPEEKALWVPRLSRLAPKHRYIQHCMLAIANLRGFRKFMISTSTSEAAYEHQLMASRFFREASSTINHQSWMGILFFGVCMLVFQFFTQSLCEESDFDPMETLQVARSTLAIVMGCRPFLKQSIMWPLILQRVQQQTIPPDPKLQDAIRNLERTIENSLDVNTYSKEVIRQALFELKGWIVFTNAHPQRWDHYCGWPAKVSPEYLELLADGDDLALVVFIHWASIMHTSLKPFVKAWTKRAALWAVSRLKADWKKSLNWPMRVFSTSLPVPELIM